MGQERGIVRLHRPIRGQPKLLRPSQGGDAKDTVLLRP